MHFILEFIEAKKFTERKIDIPGIVLLDCKSPTSSCRTKIENEIKREKWIQMREFLLRCPYNKVKLLKSYGF